MCNMFFICYKVKKLDNHPMNVVNPLFLPEAVLQISHITTLDIYTVEYKSP